jgi:IclR family transcriptional regulator, acetate operon repressor
VPVVRDLRDACRESVGLLLPSVGEAVSIHFQPALHPIRMILDLGLRLALYRNAPGKLFPAFGDDRERRRRLLASQSLEPRMPHTVTDPAVLDREFEQARKDGYIVDCGEDIDGAHCVAAPVFDGGDRLVATLVVAAPSQRMPGTIFAERGAEVAAAARALSDRLRI